MKKELYKREIICSAEALKDKASMKWIIVTEENNGFAIFERSCKQFDAPFEHKLLKWFFERNKAIEYAVRT